jgi:hypothetical protein
VVKTEVLEEEDEDVGKCNGRIEPYDRPGNGGNDGFIEVVELDRVPHR